MAVETQRGSGGTRAFVMIFFFKCGPRHARGPVARRILALEPCWNHAGRMVEPWVEPPTILVEPGSSDGLALCVFEHSACPGPRPTMSLYNIKREF